MYSIMSGHSRCKNGAAREVRECRVDEGEIRTLGVGLVGGVLGAVLVELLVRAYNPSAHDMVIVLVAVVIVGGMFAAVAFTSRDL